MDRLQAPFPNGSKAARQNPPVVAAAARVAIGPLVVVVVAMVRSQNGVLWSVQRSNAEKESHLMWLRTKYTIARIGSSVARTTKIMLLVSDSHSEWSLLRTAWN